MLSPTEMQELYHHCLIHNKFLLLVCDEYQYPKIVGYKIYDNPPCLWFLEQTKEVPNDWLDRVNIHKGY